MREEYLSAEEYDGFFETLNGIRHQIARRLPVQPGMRLLDLATGYGYFAIEIARLWRDVKIVGIDLVQADVDKSRCHIRRQNLAGRIEIARMDSTKMGFRGGSFRLVVNFLGLEDIHMTRGKTGVQQTFEEVSRVLESGGEFWFVAMPPEEMESRAQRLETQVFSHACGATWLSARAYEKMLSDAGFRLVEKESYYTKKKLAVAQAREYIRFACENVPEIYGIPTVPFGEIWKRFGRDIEKEGMGYYSKMVLFRLQNIQ